MAGSLAFRADAQGGIYGDDFSIIATGGSLSMDFQRRCFGRQYRLRRHRLLGRHARQQRRCHPDVRPIGSAVRPGQQLQQRYFIDRQQHPHGRRRAGAAARPRRRMPAATTPAWCWMERPSIPAVARWPCMGEGRTSPAAWSCAAAASPAGGGRIDVAGSSDGDGAGIELDGGSSITAGSGLVVLRAEQRRRQRRDPPAGTVSSGTAVNLRPGRVDADGAATDFTGRGDPAGRRATGSRSTAAASWRGFQRPGWSSAAACMQARSGAARSRTGDLTLQNDGGSGGIRCRRRSMSGSGTLRLVHRRLDHPVGDRRGLRTALLARADGDVLLAAARNNVAATTLAGNAGGDFEYQDVDALAIGNVTATGFDAGSGTLASIGASGIQAGRRLRAQPAGRPGARRGVRHQHRPGDRQHLAEHGGRQPARLRRLARVGEHVGGRKPWRTRRQWRAAEPLRLPVPGRLRVGVPGASATISSTCSSPSRSSPSMMPPAIRPAESALHLQRERRDPRRYRGQRRQRQRHEPRDGRQRCRHLPDSGSFTSAAGYQLQFVPGDAADHPSRLVFTADPSLRYLGTPNHCLPAPSPASATATRWRASSALRRSGRARPTSCRRSATTL